MVFICFVSHKPLYRLRSSLKAVDTIFQFLDGHKICVSRVSPIAHQILVHANDRVITLLAHTSNVCQMFGKALPAPFRCHFRIFYEQEYNLTQKRAQSNSPAQRISIISAMIKMLSQTWTFRNCQISGKKTSLWDLTLQKLEEQVFKNVDVVFEYEYANQVLQHLKVTLSIRNSLSQFYSRRANIFFSI